jgi:ketosteroid isomerase-like protein
MKTGVSRERAGRTFRPRLEILFHAALLAAATAVVSLGSRTPSAHGILLPEESDAVTRAGAFPTTLAPRAAAQKQITTAEKTWIEAHRRGDAALLRRLLADEFTFTDRTGRVSDAKEYLASVGTASEAAPGSATMTREAIERLSTRTHLTRTHLYGATAVVSGETVMRGLRGGKAFHESTRFLRVYVSRDGRWQMVAGQDTPVRETSSLWAKRRGT